jgi:4-amino-4-deoxy-L-arabinose transferase-like glycosyltransferase
MVEPSARSPTRVERFLAFAPLAVLGIACLSLVIPIASSGLWDPHELRSIDLGRRIGLHWFGGRELELEGVVNALPSRGEVDRGELPFSSIGIGLRLLGLSAWAGRLPLCVWGMLGLVATYLMVSRLADRVAAALSVVVLATMPLYFAHARTMLGDVVTMASLAMAVSGLALSLYDASSSARRFAWFGLGLVGLLCGGFSRGLLLGVAVPAVGVGLGFVATRLGGAARDPRAAVFGGVTLLVGAGATIAGLVLLRRAVDEPESYFAALGFGYSPPLNRPNFDAVLQQLGHALFPWSALVPPALARLLLEAGKNAGSSASTGLRATLVMVVAVGVTAWGGIAPFVGVLPFGAVAPLAVIVALVLRDFDLGAPGSRVFGMVAGALAVLFLVDFRNFPEEMLSLYGLGSLKFPESFRDTGSTFLGASTLGSAAVLLLVTAERARDDAPVFDPNEYRGWFRTLRDLWNGNLLFALLVLEAAALGFAAFDFVGRHVEALERFVTRSEILRPFASYGFLILPAAALLPVYLLGVRDILRLFDRARSDPSSLGLVPGRGVIGSFLFVAFGGILSLWYYPALADQLSPQESYEAFRRFARSGEPLGMIGSAGTLAPFYAGRGAVSFRGTEEAYRWLLEPGGRRFLVLRSDNLASLNSRYRSRGSPRSNLPVLDAHSSEILLVSNQLRPGERNENPLDDYLLGAEPHPTRKLDANLGGQLDVLGWDVTDLDDHPVRDVTPRRHYRFVIYYRVVERISGAWETFLHIDGFQRRFNGDHKTLDGRYGFQLWQVGDIVADRHEIELEPNFTPGTYQVYFGLYSGSRRLPVKRGAHQEDRVQGGPLTVR